MSDISLEEKQERLLGYKKDILELFEQIHPNIAKYILGSNLIRKAGEEGHYVTYIKNVLSLAFIFAYGCLKCDINNYPSISENATSQSSLRIINSLSKAYSQTPVDRELMQFVLTDIQFEMAQDSDENLYKIFRWMSTFQSDDPDEEFNLIRYFKLLNDAANMGQSRLDIDLDEVAEMFYTLLDNMTFLHRYDLVQNEDGCFSFVYKKSRGNENFRVIPVDYLLFYDRNVSRYMCSLVSMKTHTVDGVNQLQLHYLSVNNSLPITRTVCETPIDEDPGLVIVRDPEEVYAEICAEGAQSDDSDIKGSIDLITQIHAINYKYIKNLALAISDAIGKNAGSKQALCDTFTGRGGAMIFSGVDRSCDIETQRIDWDSIIVMLLIEYSPTSVLETLFVAAEQNFFDIAENLSKRIDNADMPLNGLNKRQLMLRVDAIIKEKLIFGEASGFGKLPNTNNKRLKARAQALLLISSLSAIHEEESVERSICAGNIYDNMSLLEKMKTNMTPQERCKYVCIILSETFRHILCFYKGLLSYGVGKQEFDRESSLKCKTETQIAKDQKNLNHRFMTAAKLEAEDLKRYNASNCDDMRALLQQFVDLCEFLSSATPDSESARRALCSVTGKYEILNVSEFKRYIRNSTAGLSEINEGNVNSWIAFAIHILEYLRNGTFELSCDNPTRAIYPYTATYNHGDENYDGHRTLTFTLDWDMDGDARSEKKEIKVLSEFNYNTSNVFYCLPNILRTNNTWWIDPLMIDFKAFNELFLD